MDQENRVATTSDSSTRSQPMTVDDAVTRALDGIGITRTHWIIAILVLLGVFFDVVEEGALGAAGPALVDALGISNLKLTSLQTVTIAAMIIGKFLTGVLGDRMGRRFTLTFNLAIYCAGALICALAPNFAVLAVGRFVVGLGLGGEIPAALTLLSEMISTKHRGSFTAAVNVGGGGLGNPAAFGFAALILGPLSGFFGGPDTSWRWLFGLLVLPALLVLVYRRFLPESPRFLASQGRLDEANEVFARLESGKLRGAVVVTKNYFPEHLVASAKPERPRLGDLIAGPLLRRTATLSVASWMTFGVQISVLILMPLILVDKGYEISESLIFVMLMNLGSLAGAIVATYGASRWSRRTVMTVTAVFGLINALLFGLLAEGTALILLFGTLFHFSLMLLNTTIFAWSPEIYPTRIRAFGTAIIALQGNVAGALLPLGAAVILAQAGPAGMFVAIAGLFLILIVAVRLAPETQGKTLEDINAGL